MQMSGLSRRRCNRRVRGTETRPIFQSVALEFRLIGLRCANRAIILNVYALRQRAFAGLTGPVRAPSVLVVLALIFQIFSNC
jgi:hypothetical protein